MSKRVTIKDVAKHCGYSFKTVARVIAKNPTVAEEIREKVERSIEELGYQPNISARNLRGGTSYVIGLVYENPLADIQAGALEACRKAGYFLQIMPAKHGAPNLRGELLESYQRQKMAGLLLTPPFSEDEALTDHLVKNGVAVTRIISARSAPESSLPTAYVDDFHAAHELTNHLLAKGHRRIGFIWGDPSHASTRERYAGFREALRVGGIEHDSALEVPGEYVFAAGLAGAQRLLAAQQPPTAIIGSNDEIAAGAVVACQMANLKVPEDVAVAGFENSRFSQQAWPPITTASQPTEFIAQSAIELLLAHLATNPGKKGKKPLSKGFNPELVVRASTQP